MVMIFRVYLISPYKLRQTNLSLVVYPRFNSLPFFIFLSGCLERNPELTVKACSLEVFFFLFFSIRVLFHGHWQLTGQQGKGGDHFFIPLYHFHPLTNIQTFILQLCTWDWRVQLACKKVLGSQFFRTTTGI